MLVFLLIYMSIEGVQNLPLGNNNLPQQNVDNIFPLISKITNKEVHNTNAKQTVFNELYFVNKEVNRVLGLTRTPRRLFKGELFKLINRILSELQPELKKIGKDDEVLKSRYKMSKEEIKLFKEVYKDTKAVMMQLDQAFNNSNKKKSFKKSIH